MRLKSYFAESVEAAIWSARQEMGDEAMLVNSRHAPQEGRHLGAYEVVFASATGATPVESAARPPMPPLPEPARPTPFESLAHEVANLRKQLGLMGEALAQRLGSGERVAAPEQNRHASLYSTLVQHDIHPAMASLLAGAAASSGRDDELRRCMESLLKIDAGICSNGPTPAVVALIGPPGSGKTTTLMKLAIRFGLSGRRPCHLISLDNLRIAAGDQLRAYAAILGVSTEQIETTHRLAQAIEEHSHKELILIDTPGYAVKDLDCAAELAEFFAARGDIQTHLVVPASMRAADLSRAVDRFEMFRPQRLLFTRLDETESWGALWSEAARTQKPLSFLSAGQRIPEDLEEAAAERIVDAILPSLTTEPAEPRAAWEIPTTRRAAA